jgi:hypothetical protein
LNIVMLASFLGITARSFAGLNVSTYADGPTFVAPTGAPIILQTTTTPQISDTVNQQESTGISLTHTFVTGGAGFQLNAIDIYAGGLPGGTATLNIYPNPVGGADTDGFVNTSFSTDLLNGGNGLNFTFNGNGGNHYLRLDLTGADEITLAPNTKYAIEFDITGGTFSWMRSIAGTYPDGNLYHGASELNFNGTPPANGRGERDQVGGTPQRDGGMALYGPGPGGGLIVTSRPDAATWPGSPVHTTTGTSNLTTDWNTEVTIAAGRAATQTFTPDKTFKLDKFMIRAAGAPTTGELYIFQAPQGGTEADGFVDVASGTSLVTAVPFSFSGTADRTLLEFDLTGSNEITLQAGVEYAIDIRNTGSDSMYWMRDENPYAGGNIYAQNDFTTDTQRFDVAGDGRRDGALALFAAGLAGDFNNDGKVDAADYVTWRKNSGNAPLPNDNGVADQTARYALWRSNFGNQSSPGSGLSQAAVPEPTTVLLLAISACAVGLRSRKEKAPWIRRAHLECAPTT